MSPAKPQQKAIGTRTASRQTKKTTATGESEIEGRSSEASNTSAGTTIVSKAGTGRGRPAAAAKKPAASAGGKGNAGGQKKGTVAVAAKKENVPPATATAAGGRSLRKRA